MPLYIKYIVVAVLYFVSNIYALTTVYNDLNIKLSLGLVEITYLQSYLFVLFISLFKLMLTSNSKFYSFITEEQNLKDNEKYQTITVKFIAVFVMYGLYSLVSYFAF